MKMKQLIRSLHLFAGLTSGIVIFTVAISGCIYAFEPEFRALFQNHLFEVNVLPGETKPVSTLVCIAGKKYPKLTIKSVHVSNTPGKSVEIVFKNKLAVYVDPYNGTILGAIDMERDFFSVVLKLHRNLCLGDTGKVITGCSALVLLFMLVSGIVLWWPAKRRQMRQKLSITRFFGPKRLVYDLHSVAGFYASWILLFSVVTGLTWSFKWFEASMYSLSGSVKKERTRVFSDSTQKNQTLSIDSVLLTMTTTYPKAEAYQFNFPENKKDCYRAAAELGEEGLLKKSSLLFFDQYSGKVLKAQEFEKLQAGDKLKMNNKRFHTGSVFGFTGRLIVFFAALICASLPVTGFLMWLKRP